jgi:hypothetical protein
VILEANGSGFLSLTHAQSQNDFKTAHALTAVFDLTISRDSGAMPLLPRAHGYLPIRLFADQ